MVCTSVKLIKEWTVHPYLELYESKRKINNFMLTTMCSRKEHIGIGEYFNGMFNLNVNQITFYSLHSKLSMNIVILDLDK